MNRIVGVAGAVLGVSAYVSLLHFAVGGELASIFPLLLFGSVLALVIGALLSAGVGSKHPVAVGFITGAIVAVVTKGALGPMELGVVVLVIGLMGAAAGAGYSMFSSLY